MNTDYQKYENLIKSIRNGLSTWQKASSDSRADKKGFGFNSDSRFPSFTIEKLRFDTWLGYYGNSSCSTWLNICDSVLFTQAFTAVLNRDALKLLADIADYLEKISQGAKKKEIAELRMRLTALEGVESDQTST